MFKHMLYTCCPSYICLVVISIMIKATWGETDLFYIKTLSRMEIRAGTQDWKLEAGTETDYGGCLPTVFLPMARSACLYHTEYLPRDCTTYNWLDASKKKKSLVKRIPYRLAYR